MKIGEFLKTKRLAAGLSLKQMGLNHAAVYRIEADRNHPNWQSLLLMAKSLKQPLSELIKEWEESQ